jgi:hypothetical protein
MLTCVFRNRNSSIWVFLSPTLHDLLDPRRCTVWPSRQLTRTNCCGVYFTRYLRFVARLRISSQHCWSVASLCLGLTAASRLGTSSLYLVLQSRISWLHGLVNTSGITLLEQRILRFKMSATTLSQVLILFHKNWVSGIVYWDELVSRHWARVFVV